MTQLVIATTDADGRIKRSNQFETATLADQMVNRLRTGDAIPGAFDKELPEIHRCPLAFRVDMPEEGFEYIKVNMEAGTITVDSAAILATAFAELRTKRDQLLHDTDWWVLRGSITEAQTSYRQTLRDLPANTPDPANPTWPTHPK